MTTFKLEWKDDELKTALKESVRDGIDETMAEAVAVAKPRTPVRVGILQGSIRFEPAKITAKSVTGEWGSFDVAYALWVEIGTSRMKGRHMLRTAAEITYPRLTQHVREHARQRGL